LKGGNKLIILLNYKEKTTMSDVFLSQEEADELISMEKQKANESVTYFPAGGKSKNLPLESPDRQESFFLDISRGAINLSKFKYQNRGRQVIVLLRLEIGGPLHVNPDGAEVPCPHLHIYQQGSRDKWAYPLPEEFTNPNDFWQVLQDFMSYCNVIRPPNIQRGLE
jgi:hypothetical protein